MPLAFLLDENLRGRLWQHIQEHNVKSPDPIDAVRVGDLQDLPLGSTDPDILMWAERENRILLSRDPNTMPAHLAAHLTLGRRSPGICFVRFVPLAEVVDHVALVAHAGVAGDFENRVVFIP